MAYNDLNTKFKETPDEQVTTADIETVKKRLITLFTNSKRTRSF